MEGRNEAWIENISCLGVYEWDFKIICAPGFRSARAIKAPLFRIFDAEYPAHKNKHSGQNGSDSGVNGEKNMFLRRNQLAESVSKSVSLLGRGRALQVVA